MRTLLLFLTYFFLFINLLYAQGDNIVPKNYIGFFVGIEGHTSSALKGVAYERKIHTKEQLGFGVNGIYVFKYNLKNMSWVSGSSEYRSFGLLLGTATYYTSRAKKQSGFFLSTGLGIGLTHRQSHHGVIDEWHPAGDIGLGWSIPFNASTGCHIAPSLLYASSGGIIRLKASIAL